MKELENIDKEDMASMVASFPHMLRLGGPNDELLREVGRIYTEGIDGICFLGMGGSAIAGEMCKIFLADTAEKPILTIRDYNLPNAVDSRWAVIAVSYSGNTEETIAAYKEARTRGCTTIVITTGGALLETSQDSLAHLLPSGFQPRAALPIILGGILPMVETLLNLGLTDLEKVSDELNLASKKWKSFDISPESLAKSLKGKIPVFIGWRHLIPVAYRAKCQINENSKSVAFNSEIPEMNHNEIEGAFTCASHPLIPVFLRSSKEDDRTRKRFDATSAIFEEDGCKAIHLNLHLESRILEMLGHTMFLDDASVVLAGLYNLDPVSVPKISGLKQQLD